MQNSHFVLHGRDRRTQQNVPEFHTSGEPTVYLRYTVPFFMLRACQHLEAQREQAHQMASVGKPQESATAL